MILYKNVDICDLSSIMQKGVLSMDECGNDNWDTGKRVQNDTSSIVLLPYWREKFISELRRCTVRSGMLGNRKCYD